MSQQAVGLLCVVDQSPPPATLEVMKACTEALVLEGLVKHKDKDVRLLVATSISEVMRIFAPDAPYDDDVLKVCSKITLSWVVSFCWLSPHRLVLCYVTGHLPAPCGILRRVG